ncbi:lipid droplet assembly factor 1-like [Brachionichthys hirsutus]|uniref:lipid droplet assembly factor 1-like n=1 Tax=Brachionichthys hirsutus TaxID=412623 RepID=UPI0036046A76
MQMQPSSVADLQQLWGSWSTRMSSFSEDPDVSKLMKTRTGQYLIGHPLLAVTAVTFSVVAALPVGLFLTFALVTIIMSAVGFCVFEGFLLFVGAFVLLCALVGLALFSLVVSLTFRVLYVTVSKILSYPHLAQESKNQGEESETSKLKEM